MSTAVAPDPLWDGRSAPASQPGPRPELVPPPPATSRPRRLPAPGRPGFVTFLAILAGLGLGVTLALGISAESAGSLRAPGGLLTAGGRLAGLAAGYAMVVVVILVARLPPLERAIGQDRLVRWHRKLGPWPLYLLVAHASLIVVGYARAAHDGVLHQLGQLLWTYPGILAATVGGVALIAAGVTSYKKARAKMAYETWWSVHLYTYLALFLSFSHQIHTGASFVGHRLATDYWTALWVGTLALVLVSRVGLPIWRSARHRLTVVRVIPEGPDTFSVVMRGRRLDRLPIAGGQFLQWRFLKRGLWWQAHPYSLSAAPHGDRLRITVKVFGDHSAALARLRPGTRVAIEGPYGVFTADARQGDRVLLVGAGVGITPVRALLEELPAGVEVDVILRGSAPEDLVLQREIAADVARRGGRLHQLVGSREQVRLHATELRRLVPDIAARDVYVCGPEPFQDALIDAARRAGVPASHLHHESFAL
jgi:ferredoxin-NADP reductase